MAKIFSLTQGLGKTSQSTEAMASPETEKFISNTPLGLLMRVRQSGRRAHQEFSAFSESIGLDPRVAELAAGGLTGPVAKTKELATKAPQIITRVRNVADDVIAKLTQAVKTAKPLRGALEKEYAAQRATRFKAASQAQTAVGGREGYFAGLSKLKGALVDKPPTFTPPTESLSPEDVKSLYTAIQQNPLLDMGNQLTGQRGLTKLLDGHVPVPSELKVMEEVFGSDVVRALWDRRPLSKKIWDLGMEIIADVPRALKTTGDMSATLRQGAVTATRHPIRFSQAFGRSFKHMLNNGAFEDSLDSMRMTPEYRTAVNSGLQLSDPRKLMGQREELFLGQLAERIPGVGQVVKASNRAYVSFSNSLRFDIFNDLAQDFATHSQADEKTLTSLADFVNTSTGRGKLPFGLEKSASTLSRLLFAPKYVMSRLQWFNPFWYKNQAAPVRKEALKTAASFVGTVSSVITLAKMGGADVETDWRSSNFGKMKVGNTYYDLTAGFGQYIRLFGQLVTNSKKTGSGEIKEFGGEGPFDENFLQNFERVLRGKLAPLPSTIANLVAGENVVGEPATPKSELRDNVIPLYFQDVAEAMKDQGPEALFLPGLPAFFGIGVSTFENKNKVDSLRSTPNQKREKIESLR